MAEAHLESRALFLLGAGLSALKGREDDVNRMNVFPVPDGDTGTNMVLTMQAVWAECAKVDAADNGALAKAATNGSLMGARGNSGVILSQVIRGLGDVLGAVPNDQAPGVGLVAEALAAASKVSLQAIRKPVAGTMLTVMEDVANEAAQLARTPIGMAELLEALVDAAWRSVQRTPDLLPVLKEAGVVDAGGFGLAILGEGIVRAALGGTVAEHAEMITTPKQLSIETEAEELEYKYCTELLLAGDPPPVEQIKGVLETMGGSLMVVAGPGVLKVHVHTNDPGQVLSYLSPFGVFAETHINNMEEQAADRRADLEAARLAAFEGLGAEKGAGGALGAGAATSERRPLGVIAVAAGKGVTTIMKSLGVDQVVPGGQSMNPSTGEIAAAARAANADTVIVLPNNKNVILAAQQTASAFDAERETGGDAPHVIVVGTRTVPEGLSALLAYDASGVPEAISSEMEEEMGRVTSGAVTTAVRDSSAAAGPVRAGDVIGVSDSDILVVGRDVVDVAAELTSVLAKGADGAESVTLLAGEDLPDDGAQALAEAVKKKLPSKDVEWHRGDQPLYPVLIGIE